MLTKEALFDKALRDAALRSAHVTTNPLDHLVNGTVKRDIALERLRIQALENMTPKAPDHIADWINTVLPHLKLAPPGQRHWDLWDWTMAIKRNVRPRPFVGIWPRGSGKSTTAEIATVFLGAKEMRRYVWYISATQALADLHVESIGALMEGTTFSHYYPRMAQRQVGKFGNLKGWRRNRMRAANGFTIDALGLDSGARGSKIEEQRPDLIILDDIDDATDSDQTIDKKVETITKAIMPAGSSTVAILAIQNLISKRGFFGRMVSGKADYMTDRILSGPFPAVYNLTTEQRNGRFIITGGEASWVGQPLDVCQTQIDSWGISAFLSEAQHETREEGSLFGHIKFVHCETEQLPPLVRIITCVDPAVTSTDNSDSHGISIVGLGEDNKIYVLWCWEGITGPEDSVKRAIEKSIEYGSDTLLIESNQGGDMWQSVYDIVISKHGFERYYVPQLQLIQATAATGSKIARATQMLADYEVGNVVHVNGTHMILEAALSRFPISKPYDLVDSTVHAWRTLRSTATWLIS